MTAYERLIDALRDHGNTVIDNTGKAKAQCPAHDDRNPSLCVTRIEGSVLVYCQAGCVTDDVLAAVGLTKRDLFDDRNGATYRYPGGRTVHRDASKRFHQSGDTKDRTLFRADRLGDAQIVYVCEGEKDVLAVEAVGASAVCAAGGAGKAHLFDWSPLKQRDVIVVADKDKPGRAHAEGVAKQLKNVAKTVRLVEAAIGKDAADHLAAGKTLDELVAVDSMPAEDPIPLIHTVPIPPFPVDALPQPIADKVNAVAEHTQTDPAMAGTSGMSSLSACTGGRAEIEIRPGWREPLCLYTASINAPGERKSAVQMTMVEPVYAAERELAQAATPAHRDAATRRDIALKNAERLRNAAAKQDDPRDRDRLTKEAVFAVTEAEGIHVPPIPRLVCDDITPEALGSLLAEQGGRAALITAEAGVFSIMGGRYSNNIPNLDIWLKGHSGDPVRVDRKNRPPEYIPRPALTVGLMIQPSVLDAIAANREFRGRGLLARFLYAYPASRVGRRKVETAPVPETVEKAYADIVCGLARDLGGHSGEPAVLKLSETAYKAIVLAAETVEPRLADDGELGTLKDWGSKYVGAIARIAGILHLAEHGTGGVDEPVSAVTIRNAYRIGEYFKACAVRAFTEMGTDQATADAVYLLDRIHRLGCTEVSERDMHVACRSRFNTKAEIMPALDRLVDHGYLIPQPKETTAARGRPKSPKYTVATQTTQHTEIGR